MMSLQKDYILLQILVEDDYPKLFGRVGSKVTHHFRPKLLECR
jgi:hypothetical protein